MRAVTDTVESRTAFATALVRLATAGALAVALAVGALLWSPGRAGAEGLVFGCPAGSGSMGFPQGFGIHAVVDGVASETIIDLDAATLAGMMALDPGWRSLDVDQDGLHDLRWHVRYQQPLADTNLDDLWTRIGGDITTNALDIRITFERLASDPDLAPMKLEGELPLPMTVPVDPNDPDGPTTTEMHGATFGFDTRATGSIAPTKTVFDIVVQAGSPAQPDTDHLGVRFATEYRVGSDLTAPLIAPGTEPPVETLVAIGPEVDVGRDLDLSIAWDRAPAQLAFDKATTCTAADPHQVLAWDYRPDQNGTSVSLDATDAEVDLVTGRGQGVGGHDSFGLHGTVEHVPDALTIDLTETDARLRQHQHGGSASAPAPNIELDQLLITEPAVAPAQPTKLLLTGKLIGLPPEANLTIKNKPTGGLSSVDLRFCPGTSWTDPACQADVRAAELVELVVSDVLPGNPDAAPPVPAETTKLPPLPSTSGPYVAYTERDVKGFLPSSGEKHFRGGGRLPKVKRLLINTPPLIFSDGAGVVTELTADAPATKVLIDSDRRKIAVPPSGPATVSDQAVRFDGQISPFPKKVDLMFGKAGTAPFIVNYNFFTTKAAVAGDLMFLGGTSSNLLDIRAKAQLGDATSGLPTKGTLWFYELANGVRKIDYDADAKTRVKVGATVSTGPQRAQGLRHRIWADADIGDRVVAEWQANGGSLQNVEVRPCAAAPCVAATPIAERINARVVSGPPIANEQGALLTAPALPAIDHTDVYPAFTPTPRGATFVKLRDGRWGAAVELTGLKRARVEDHSTPEGTKVNACVESVASTASDRRFGTRLYVNGPPRETGDPESPFYADGVLSDLPPVMDVRIDDKDTKTDASKPWLWLHTASCSATSPPPSRGEPRMSGVTYRLLTKAGHYATQQKMKTDPLGKAPLALAKPTDSTPFGATVRALRDSVDGGTGFDVSGRIDLPVHTVVHRPRTTVCDESVPAGCQDLATSTRKERFDAELRVQSTSLSFGAVDALVRLRSRMEATSVPSLQTPNTCTAAGDDTVCDLDIKANLKTVPGKFQVVAKMATSARIPDVTLVLALLNTASDLPQYPVWGEATATVRDDANPSATGVRWNSAGTPVDRYRIRLTDIAHHLTATVRYQGTETLPGKEVLCPDAGYGGRGSTDFGYLDADLDVGGATNLVASARTDHLGRFSANLQSNQRVNGTVRTKVENVGVGEKFELPAQFIGTTDVNLCVDMDLPFEMQLIDTLDASLGADLVTWALRTPASDPAQQLKVRFGEQHGASWLAGAVWFVHAADFDPEGSGHWTNVVWPGRKSLGLMPPASWQGQEPKAYYTATKTNEIATGSSWSFAGSPSGYGKLSDGTIQFSLDPFWTDAIRDDMYCRDENAGDLSDDCEWLSVPSDVRPGLLFHQKVALRGHLPETGPITFGEQTPTAPGTSATVIQTIAPTYTVPDAETSEQLWPSGHVLTAPDGTRYRMHVGIDQGDAFGYMDENLADYEFDSPVSLTAEYGNGVTRWRREVGSGFRSACGVKWQCKLTATVTNLDSGHVQVTWKLESYRIIGGNPIAWVTDTEGTKVFDPSGFGGKADLPTETVNATAGQPVDMRSTWDDPDIAQYQHRKVWYFGDGSVAEAGIGASPSTPVPHTYAHPGTYPAVLVYYDLHDESKTWEVDAVLPQKVVVAPAPP